MSEHTPGPWRWNATNGDPNIYGVKGEGQVARASEHFMNRSERDANARLIAAAPEMLEALKAAVAPPREGPEFKLMMESRIRLIRSAIAKAESGEVVE